MRRSRLVGVVVAIAIAALTALAAVALAATGSLTYGGCIANAGNDDCSTPLRNSLGNNVGLAVSPDTSTVYVATVEGALTEFSHDAGGGLTFEDCLADGGSRKCRDIPHDSLDA